jgi:type II secretion system protein G
MTYFSSRRSVRGFSLVELLVVVAIIGVLTAIVMTSLSGAKQKARDSKRAADLKSIQLALSLYYADNGMYPKNIYGTGASAPDSGLAPTYLPTVPKDPNANTTDVCSDSGVNGRASCYHYSVYVLSGICSVSNPPVLYHLGATFEDTTNSVLTQDSDASQTLNPPYATTYTSCGAGYPAAFDGNAANCQGGTPTTPDPCYDLTP